MEKLCKECIAFTLGLHPLDRAIGMRHNGNSPIVVCMEITAFLSDRLLLAGQENLEIAVSPLPFLLPYEAIMCLTQKQTKL